SPEGRKFTDVFHLRSNGASADCQTGVLRFVPMNQVTWDDLELKEVLGAGGFGTVHRAVLRSSGAEVAVKVLRDRAHLPSFRREVETLLSLTHDGIMRLLAYNLEADP